MRRAMTAEKLAKLPPDLREAFYSSLDPEEKSRLLFHWPFWARDKQLAPLGDWVTWLVLAGRGFGKSRTGAEWVRDQVQFGHKKRFALVARTASDVRDVMIEGESGILSVSPPWFKPKYEPTKRRLTWPNGAIATTYTGDEPDQLRGPQHDGAWCDELAAWRYPESWDQLQFGMRIGKRPQTVVTTTPRPTPIIRNLIKESEKYPNRVKVTVGTTHENAANLAPSFLTTIVNKYEGTRLGKQELYAAILDDNPGALWNRARIEQARVGPLEVPPLTRVVVAVDPSVHDGSKPEDERKAEAGIIGFGTAKVGGVVHGYLLDDKSMFGSPLQWATDACSLFDYLEADRLIAEQNNGGALVETTVRTVNKNIPYDSVYASRGKLTRAEPVSALYEQGRIHHVGYFVELEDQLCDWVPGMPSPDRLDALVWAATYTMCAGKSSTLSTSNYA